MILSLNDARSRMEVADKHIWHGDYGWQAPKGFPEPVKKRSEKSGTMGWQLQLVIALVILALVYLGRQALYTWRGKGDGCGGCKHHGSASKSNTKVETLIPLEQVRLRRR